MADDGDPEGRFRLTLVLAWETGRRISAIAHLRVSDILMTKDAMTAALAESGHSDPDAAAKVWNGPSGGGPSRTRWTRRRPRP